MVESFSVSRCYLLPPGTRSTVESGNRRSPRNSEKAPNIGHLLALPRSQTNIYLQRSSIVVFGLKSGHTAGSLTLRHKHSAVLDQAGLVVIASFVAGRIRFCWAKA
jgi:hypothetical protein